MSETPKTKKPVATKQQQRKKATNNTQTKKETWVHIDNYLVTLDARDEVKQGFRIYMRKQAYQKSYEAFDEHFEKFLKRKI